MRRHKRFFIRKTRTYILLDKRFNGSYTKPDTGRSCKRRKIIILYRILKSLTLKIFLQTAGSLVGIIDKFMIPAFTGYQNTAVFNTEILNIRIKHLGYTQTGIQ